MKTIHLLHEGRTPCGMDGVPANWPPGHVWLGSYAWPKNNRDYENLKNKDAQVCSTCDDEFRKQNEQ